jgi:cytochrome c oxidase subunit 2
VGAEEGAVNELFQTMLNLPPQASSVAREIDVFHYVVIGLSILGAVGVAAAAGLFILRWREGARPRRPAAERSLRGILVFEATVIIGLLGLFIGFWVVGFRQYLTLRTVPAGAIDVYVVAKQWMWAFAYPNGTGTSHDLVVPVGRPVRLTMTSRDVIHSFFVPEFRVKQDVVPGRATVTWFEATRPGVYDILCTEYCGAYHSTMRGRVIVLGPAEMDAWERGRRPLLSRTEGVADLAAAGERVAAERGCLRCHTLDGTPHLGPTWAGLYGSTVPLVDGRTVVADDAFLTASMMDPNAMVHAGYQPIMPSYQGLLDAVETAALVALLRQLAVPAPDAPLRKEPLPGRQLLDSGLIPGVEP